MTPPDTPDPKSAELAAALRAWAKGVYSIEAATELLIRAFGGRFARAGHPWVHQDPDGWTWIEFEAIPANIGPLSGGERRFLMIVASIGADVPINLGEMISGLDRDKGALVLAAISHAAGTHEHSEYVPTVLDDGTRLVDPTSPWLDLGPLYPWPAPQ